MNYLKKHDYIANAELDCEISGLARAVRKGFIESMGLELCLERSIRHVERKLKTLHLCHTKIVI